MRKDNNKGKYQRLQELLIELGEIGLWEQMNRGSEAEGLYPAILELITTAINYGSSAGAIKYLLCAMKAKEDLAVQKSELGRIEYLSILDNRPDVGYSLKAARAEPAAEFLREIRGRSEDMAEPIKLAAKEILVAWRASLTQIHADGWIRVLVECRNVVESCLPDLVREASDDTYNKERLMLSAAAQLATTCHLYASHNRTDKSAGVMLHGAIRNMSGDDLAVMARHGELLLGVTGFIQDMATDAARDIVKLDEQLKKAMEGAVKKVIDGKLIWFGTGVAYGTSVNFYVLDEARLTTEKMERLTDLVNQTIREVFTGNMARFFLDTRYVVKVFDGRTGMECRVWET